MATCPRCKGHLTDSHRCPRRPAIVALEITAAALGGGFVGLLLLAMFDQASQIPDGNYVLSVFAGAMVGISLHHALRG